MRPSFLRGLPPRTVRISSGTARSVCPDSSAKVLDIGRSALTTKLLSHYEDVSTLGFPLGEESPDSLRLPAGTRSTNRMHIVFDLNDAGSGTPIGTGETFDLIVLAEVLEHLYTAPELVLFALKRLLRPGGWLIVQPPNAAALLKRLQLLAGINPCERIRINRANPGRFREYTKRELVSCVKGVGLVVTRHEFRDYFGIGPMHRTPVRIQRALARLVPPFARGQTLVARNPA